MWVTSDSSGVSGPFCIGSPLTRVKESLGQTSPAGETTFYIEALVPDVGQTVYFQFWHRLPGGGGSDVSGGIGATFL